MAQRKKILFCIYVLSAILLVGVVLFWVQKNNITVAETQKKTVVDSFISKDHTIPVVSITTDPKNLWDPEIGIYTEGNHDNFMQTGKDWERPATFSYYEVGKDKGLELGFSRQIGLRLHGNALRSMPQKPFRIYFKDEFGNNSKLKYPLFDNDRTEVFSTLVLRNGDPSYALIREQVATTLASQAGKIDVMRGKPVAVYLNGEYWGLYYLRERFDQDFFEERYGVNSDYVGLLYAQLGSDPKGHLLPDTKQSKKDAEIFNQLVARAKRCLNCVTVGDAKGVLDIDNMIDYYLFELFFTNSDWPYNNLKVWRYQTEQNFPPESKLVPELDGRFRWLLFDFDGSMGSGNLDVESMTDSAVSNNPYGALLDNNFPFANLFYDQEFSNLYQNRASTLLDTVLSSENTGLVVDEVASKIEPEVARHTLRWNGITGIEGQAIVSDYETWQEQVLLLKTYLQSRQSQFAKSTKVFFNEQNASEKQLM